MLFVSYCVIIRGETMFSDCVIEDLDRVSVDDIPMIRRRIKEFAKEDFDVTFCGQPAILYWTRID